MSQGMNHEQQEAHYVDLIARMTSRYYRNLSQDGIPMQHIPALTASFIGAWVAADMQTGVAYEDVWEWEEDIDDGDEWKNQ